MNSGQGVTVGARQEDRIIGPSRRAGGGLIKILVIVSVILAFCGALVYAYNKGQRQNTAYIPPNITAPGPTKVKPADPGGMEFMGKDSELLNIEKDTRLPLEDSDAGSASKTDRKSPSEAAEPGDATGGAPPTAQQRPVTAPARKAPESRTAEVRTQEPVSPTETPQKLAAVKETDPSEANVRPRIAPPGRKPPPPDRRAGTPKAVPPSSPSRLYFVQISALRSEEAVRNSWTRLKSRHTDILADQKLIIDRLQSESSGVFFRLRVGPFVLGSAARELCDKLKARKQDCYVLHN